MKDLAVRRDDAGLWPLIMVFICVPRLTVLWSKVGNLAAANSFEKGE